MVRYCASWHKTIDVRAELPCTAISATVHDLSIDLLRARPSVLPDSSVAPQIASSLFVSVLEHFRKSVSASQENLL